MKSIRQRESSGSRIFVEGGNAGRKRRRRNGKKRIIRVLLLVVIIALICCGGVLFHQHSVKAKEEKAKAEKELKIKKEKEAKKKAEEKKKKELEKQLASIKPHLAAGENAAQGVPVSVLEAVTHDSLEKAYEGTLVIGDSRTEGLKLFSGIKSADFFSTKSLTVNRIVEGKQVVFDGVTSSIYDVISKKQYGKVVTCVGLNEVGWGSSERFAASYAQLIDKIREKQPTAQIYLQAILPVSQAKNDREKVFTNANIVLYNEAIVRLASEKGIMFINPAAPLIDGTGALLDEASFDGIHLSAPYCKIWGQSLAQIISPGVLVKEEPPQAQENSPLPTGESGASAEGAVEAVSGSENVQQVQ